MFWKKKDTLANGQRVRDNFAMIKRLEKLEARINSLTRIVAKYKVNDPIEYVARSHHFDNPIGHRIGVVSSVRSVDAKIYYTVYSSDDDICQSDVIRKVKTKKGK